MQKQHIFVYPKQIILFVIHFNNIVNIYEKKLSKTGLAKHAIVIATFQ